MARDRTERSSRAKVGFVIVTMMMAASLASALYADAQSIGFRPAVGPLISLLRRRYPQASTRFANCPGNNKLPREDGSNGQVCEFRVIDHRGVFKGSALMVRHGRRWSPEGKLFVIGPISRGRHRCSLRGVAHESQRADLLEVKGATCQEAHYIAYMIGYLALNSGDLRIPNRFTEGENGTNTLGFVVSRYHCRGRVRIRQGFENPYGRETASCRTRFGDRLVFVFDQHS